MKYIFASDRLYPVDRELDTDPHGGIRVEPDTLICYDVEGVGNNNLMGADTWQFKVEGKGDTLFRTHYAWALVQLTEINVANHKAFRRLQLDARLAEQRARAYRSRVRDVRHPEAHSAAPTS